MRKLYLLSLILVVFNLKSVAQIAPFNIQLEPINITGLAGIQSFSFGQHEGKWLIIGGRLDGLHRRQPFAAFDLAGHNNQLIVVDPSSKQKWTAPLTSLPTSIQEQLSSTNMEFYQDDSMLYCIGGYGYSNSAGDHITYPNLTAINVPLVINSIINGKSFHTYFKQITHQNFGITGGHLEKIYDTYYLVGGQKFEGRYNPMGPDHGPGFIQQYTNAIRKFSITNNSLNFSIKHLSTVTDSVNLHRRDYNVAAQIMPNGQEGLTAFSGVFQTIADIPYLNCVNIDSSGYSVNNAFSQYYNHYHCANIGLYSNMANEMHTVFFGGIAQYYDSSNILVQDNDVPFVKTIARVTRNGSGLMAEYKLPVQMPALLGAGSEFILNEDLPKYENHVLKLDNLKADTTLVGYIFGGISSSAANVFFTNTGTQSVASSQIFKVNLIKNSTVGIHELNPQSKGSLHMQVYPNPNNGHFVIKFNLAKPADLNVSIFDMEGKLLKAETLTNLETGENLITYKIKKLNYGKTYMVTLETPYEKATQKIIINE
jgi:hypothetical protein